MTQNDQRKSWDNVTVAVQKDRSGNGFVLVAIDDAGQVLAEVSVSHAQGRFMWASLVTMILEANP